MSGHTGHWHKYIPPALPTNRATSLDPWRITASLSGRTLLWVVPGYTHVIGSVN